MALATQCPFCQTTFRVAQDQLKLRGGLVRCGSCKEVFNGNEHLVSPDVAQQLVAAPPSSAIPNGNRAAPTAWPKLPGSANTLPVAAPSVVAPIIPPRPPVDLSAAFASIAAEINDAPWGTQMDSTPPASPQPAAPVRTTAPASFPLPGAPTKATATSSAAVSLDPADQAAINTLTQELSYPIPLTSSADQENVATPSDKDAMQAFASPVAKHADTETATEDRDEVQDEDEDEDEEEESEEEEEDYDEDDADAPAFVQKAERRERLRRIGRIVMSVGAVLLSIALLLQATYVWRNAIAAWLPATRPLLSAVCAALHCSVGLPTNIDQLSLESSELQLVPPSQNIYTLTLLLRNRGYSAQAWPYMELTLNDADEKAITRRVFTPREYLGSATLIDDGLAGEGEQQVKLTFELAQPAASGYRIYLFYP